jgi:hypothetical protein
LITLQPEVLRTYGLFVDTQLTYKQYAKTIGTTAEMLTTQQKQQALLNEVLKQGKNITGAYEAAMQSASKQMRSWPRYVDDIMVAMGAPFQGAFSEAAGAVSKLLKSFRPMVEEGGAFYPILQMVAEWAGRAATAFSTFISSIDFNKLALNIQGIIDYLKNLSLSEAIDAIMFQGYLLADNFSNFMQGVDWVKVSDDIIAGINSINWAFIGETVRVIGKRLFSGIEAGATGINWGGMLGAVAMGLNNFLAGLLGLGNAQAVIDQWINNIMQSFEIRDKIRAKFVEWQNATSQGIADWALKMQADLKGWQDKVIGGIVSALGAVGQFVLNPFGGGKTATPAKASAGAKKYASGTSGWETVPSGYPNDTYPIALSSGERYAVIPSGGGSAVMAGGGGGNMIFNLTLQSAVSILDEQRAKTVLYPFVEAIASRLKSEGKIA